MKKKYVQYGCGTCAPDAWENYDVSPTLRIQKIPVISLISRQLHSVDFPANVKYGNIVEGLPDIQKDSCDGVFCSHVLEHLTLEEFRQALKNSYDYLKPGGIFRLIVPDLEFYINQYLEQKENNIEDRSYLFMKGTHLGYEAPPKGFVKKVMSVFGTSKHKWMWDRASIEKELKAFNYQSIRECFFHDSEDEHFKLVEDKSRFADGIGFECKK